MTDFTLHTDESGSFEGRLAGGHRLIAGVLLPRMKPHGVARLRQDFEAIAHEYTGEASLAALHGSDGAFAHLGPGKRDALARELLKLTLGRLQLPKLARLVLVLHRGRPGQVEESGLGSAGFAANRYHRMLVELARQVLGYLPQVGAGDRIALELASRVFPVARRDLPELEGLGYRCVYATRDDRRPRMFIGDAATIRTALQTLLGPVASTPQASVFSLHTESIRYTDDPRFILADFLSNYVWRRFEVLTDKEWKKHLGLGALGVVPLEFGAALDALTRCSDAVAAGDISLALAALDGVEQPYVHLSQLQDVMDRLTRAAKSALREDPSLADRLLDRAERILEFRDYSMLRTADRLAKVVLSAAVDGDAGTLRRAHAVRGTVANHRGRYADGVTMFEDAIVACEAEPPTLASLLARMDLENRRAVTEMNAFHFDIDERLSGPLKLVHGMVRKALGDTGRERVAGELAGTLAQAAAYRRDWQAANRYFPKASHHLGDDHMQASYRAHAAMDRGRKTDAVEAVTQALGSRYGREGYDLEAGADLLRHPVDSAIGLLESEAPQPFSSWLVLKLLARGWLDQPSPEELSRLSRVVTTAGESEHPHMLIRLALGHVMVRASRETDAITIWERAYREFAAVSKDPTLGAIHLQLPAHLALAGAPPRTIGGRNPRTVPWAQVLCEDAKALLVKHPVLEPWFGDTIRGLLDADPNDAEAIRVLLDRFRFTYTS